MFEQSKQNVTNQEKGATIESSKFNKERMHPLATNFIESGLIKTPVEQVWQEIKKFELDRLFPSLINNVKFESGSPKELGSVYTITYKDKSQHSFRLIELNDKKRKIAFELIGANPDVSFSSLNGAIRCRSMTEDNSTFVGFEYEFTNDIDAETMKKWKEMSKAKMADLKKCFKTS